MTVIPFDTDDDAVAIANDCPFGLGSSVFSGSMGRGRAIAACLEAGECLFQVVRMQIMALMRHEPRWLSKGCSGEV